MSSLEQDVGTAVMEARPDVSTPIIMPLLDAVVEDPVTLEEMVSGDVRVIKDRMKRQGHEETFARLKDEVRLLMDVYGGPPGVCCSTAKAATVTARATSTVASSLEGGGDSQAVGRVDILHSMLLDYLPSRRGALRDSNANYLEVLIAIKYYLKVLYLQKNSKRTIGDLLEILYGERCPHCCAPMENECCQHCTCHICGIFDEDLVVDRFRNKTRTGRWLQCPLPTCGTYVHADGAIDNGLVKLRSQCRQDKGFDANKGAEEGNEVVWECPKCCTQLDMFAVVRETLTQGGGVKKKDMGKLAEEMDRAIRCAQLSPLPKYRRLFDALTVLRAKNEGPNKTISDLRTLFGIPDRRYVQSAAQAANTTGAPPSGPPGSQPPVSGPLSLPPMISPPPHSSSHSHLTPPHSIPHSFHGPPRPSAIHSPQTLSLSLPPSFAPHPPHPVSFLRPPGGPHSPSPPSPAILAPPPLSLQLPGGGPGAAGASPSAAALGLALAAQCVTVISKPPGEAGAGGPPGGAEPGGGGGGHLGEPSRAGGPLVVVQQHSASSRPPLLTVPGSTACPPSPATRALRGPGAVKDEEGQAVADVEVGCSEQLSEMEAEFESKPDVASLQAGPAEPHRAPESSAAGDVEGGTAVGLPATNGMLFHPSLGALSAAVGAHALAQRKRKAAELTAGQDAVSAELSLATATQAERGEAGAGGGVGSAGAAGASQGERVGTGNAAEGSGRDSPAGDGSCVINGGSGEDGTDRRPSPVPSDTARRRGAHGPQAERGGTPLEQHSRAPGQHGQNGEAEEKRICRSHPQQHPPQSNGNIRPPASQAGAGTHGRAGTGQAQGGPAAGPPASLHLIRGSVEEALVGAVVAKVEKRRAEQEERRRQLAALGASAAARRQEVLDRQAVMEGKILAVEREVGDAVRRAEELEAQAKVARRHADGLVKGKQERVTRLEEEQKRWEEEVMKAGEEERRRREELEEGMREGEEKLKEMEKEMEEMVGRVKEMMSKMVTQLDSWGQ